MEDKVKDAVLDVSDDLVLNDLIEITRTSIADDRPLFSLMEEPTFYRRYFKRWVREALEEKNATNQAIQEGIKSALDL